MDDLVYVIQCMFCKRENCRCHYEVSGFHGNELSSVNKMHKLKLRNRSQMSDQSYVSVYRIYSVNIDNSLM
jgi:hypothetical protein